LGADLGASSFFAAGVLAGGAGVSAGAALGVGAALGADAAGDVNGSLSVLFAALFAAGGWRAPFPESLPAAGLLLGLGLGLALALVPASELVPAWPSVLTLVSVGVLALLLLPSIFGS
jgi:hypothetical protein